VLSIIDPDDEAERMAQEDIRLEKEMADPKSKLIKPKMSVTFRRGKEPEPMSFKGFYEKYMTKTQLRTINHTANRTRWKKIIEADLYSRTEQGGVPIMKRV
jgi:hypothetical protein